MNALADAFLNGGDLEDCRIEKVRLEDGQAVLSRYFFSVCFVDCDFSMCDLSGCAFRDCKFENCNLSLVKLSGAVMDDVAFVGCQLMGVNWTVMKWPKRISKRKSRFSVSFSGCVLNFSVFVGMDMCYASFADCVMKEACFEDADMEGAKFVNADLASAAFGNTNLTKADLSTARNYRIDPSVNILKGAKFSFPEAISLVWALDIEIVE